MDQIIMNKVFNLRNDDLDESSISKINIVTNNKLSEFDRPLNTIENINNEVIFKPQNELIFDFNKLLETKRSSHEYKFYITLEEFICSLVCPCCSSRKVKKKINIFNEMTKHIIEYTDIVSFAVLKSKFEKLLYVILTERQYALFNLLDLPQNPQRKGEKSNMTKAYEYIKNFDEQQIEVVSNVKEWEGDIENKLLYMLS